MADSRFFLILPFAFFLAGCTTIPEPTGTGSDAKAAAILRASADAQGITDLHRLNDIHVHFHGNWSWLVPNIQPVLCDIRFRGDSDEDYLVNAEVATQTHTGPGGTKTVVKKPGEIHVLYNGVESNAPDVKDAAALVVDDYRMFLLGPAFFIQRSAPVQYLGTESIDGILCDNLLTRLTPGLGNSPADRVILSIDQKQRWLRRVRLTVDGLSTTKGAVADIFLQDPIRIGGIVFPTRFYEELKNPFDVSVHHWQLTGIDLNPMELR
jgi:hypothetical protein